MDLTSPDTFAEGFPNAHFRRLREQTPLSCPPPTQHPAGVQLARARGLRLLAWAGRTGACVSEDDYDGDFRHHGSPLTALAGLDRHGCVVHMGTFSKSIGAGLRLGYLVVPDARVATARPVKTLLDHRHAWPHPRTPESRSAPAGQAVSTGAAGSAAASPAVAASRR